jgi:mitochondrial chaperone BCS1
MNILQTIGELAHTNPLFVGAISMYGIGILTYLLRSVPVKIWNFVKNQFTTSLTVTSQHIVYHNMLSWFECLLTDKRIKTLKLSNGRYGHGRTVLSFGYGTHIMWYKCRFLLVTLTKDSENKTEFDKDTLTIIILGRSRTLFLDMLHEISDMKKDETKIDVYKANGDSWAFVRSISKRSRESVFLEHDIYARLFDGLDRFIQKEDWYIEMGIPYHLGILLYGPPGTGKSSLVRVIASYLDYAVYYLGTENISKLEGCVSNLPDKSVLVIEDIDSTSVVHERGSKEENSQDGAPEHILADFQQATLSSILNSLDGLFAPHGRILIATTNHMEKLDAALVRPGRIDMKLHISYVTSDIIAQFFSRFFPDQVNISKLEFHPNLTLSDLQGYVIEDYTAMQILDTITIN